MRNQPLSLVCGLSLLLALALAPAATTAGDLPTPDNALKLLQEGHARYQTGQSIHPRADQARRDLTSTKGQHPFATVMACSDSREPVEIIFDQGIGDLFIIRVAGNVSGEDEIGSIEYGVDHLNTPVMVVLGHTHCGAVTAAVTGAEVHGSIPFLVEKIVPAVEKAQKSHPDLHGENLVPEAIKANVWQAIEDLLKKSPAVRARVKDGRLKVVGAIYDLATGGIEWLGEHPDQGGLLASSGG